MTKEEIAVVLESHKHWLAKDIDGWETMRADLSGANLRGADLSGANLSGADLSGAYLRGANLRGAYLSEANLTEANLSGAYLTEAYLTEADLSRADLSRADLSGAYLRGANLRGAYLSGADLTEADLSGAYLRGANLSRADLSRADLSGADLTEAYLRGAYLTEADLREVTPSYVIPLVCPSDGAFIAWKKAGDFDNQGRFIKNIIVKLLVPADALRSSATSRKCRCNKAMCLAAYIMACDGTKQKLPIGTTIRSIYNHEFSYTVGDWIEAGSFDPDRWNECSNGIHFFITEEEAIEY